MPYLGRSLKEISEAGYSDKMMNKLILKVGIQLTERLEVLHNLGYIHNDLNPANIVISEDLETVSLIDFGIAEPYMNSNGTHRRKKLEGTFKGNKVYCSTNACNGYTK